MDKSKSHEEEYFRKHEQVLIEKMRRRAQAEAERRQMGEALGTADEDILNELQALGYTRETVMLLHLMPLVQVAWSEGDVTRRERDIIFEAARLHGVEDGSPVHRQLINLFDVRPADEYFDRTRRIIGDLLQAMPAQERQTNTQSLFSYCTRIASASGGILGFGPKVSAAEQALLEQIAAEFEHDHEAAARQIVAGS
jgi:hypothetical protein